jgi:predicted MFS family arabinose efflux permease
MAVVGCAVGEAANSYRTLLAARLIQGFATCAFESLTFASVGYVLDSFLT